VDEASTGLAAYRRVAEAIKGQIRSGVLQPGDQLPSNRKLAEAHDVALGTAQKALGVLQDEGWLIATPAVGVFVNDRDDHEPDTLAGISKQLDELQATVADLSRRLDRLEGEQGE